MENLVDATDPECDPEPLVTLPDSQSPSPVNTADIVMNMSPLSPMSISNNANNSTSMLSSECSSFIYNSL